MNSWENYYQKNQGRSLRPLYVQAIPYLHSSARRAMDLGCGIGMEVLDLLRRGFEVHAVDQEPQSIERVVAAAAGSAKLIPHLSSLEVWKEWPSVDFLFAHHSFPFCVPGSFDSVVERAFASVALGGVLAVSFFGPEDEWVLADKVVGVSADSVKTRLHDFEILHFEEIRKVGPTALQGNKMWDVIEVIAKRREPV